MIKGNTIYFGYGDIAVGYTPRHLTLQWFKPPQEVGNILIGKEVNWLSDEIKLSVTHKDLVKIQKINEHNDKQIVIDGYVLDFSNFNSMSVRIVKDHIQNALFIFQLALAC